MTTQTPRRPGLGSRPSQQAINTASSPNLSAMARKASLNALTAYSSMNQASTGNLRAGNAVGGDGQELSLGDVVDVPGDMHGVIRFIGSVKGKKGTFAGVELSALYAANGKNDGDVDGIRYFTTTRPGAGIFLPIHRATKRSSRDLSADAFSPTSTVAGPAAKESAMPKFSQSVGPGARLPSPQLKYKQRPSLPRPESPQRKVSGMPAPLRTPGRAISSASFSKSVSAISTPLRSPSSSNAMLPKPKPTPTPGRSYSRNSSRLNNYEPISEDADATTPTPATRTSDCTSSHAGPQRSASNDAEMQRLQQKLDDRDRQLKEQAASLAEMETSLLELQLLIPSADQANGHRPSALARQNSNDNTEAAELRLMLREKNDKIELLTAEFDNHRADFRSTIDTLEMASGETQRVYDQRIEELVQELRDVQERSTDVDGIAQQLKQLEELVQALEEDVEDARRGEAEARSEVEFLRGEVERGRSELKREREKAADALKGASMAVDTSNGHGSREVEQRDDEIRGLKAIIHSLSSAPDANSPVAQKHHSRAAMPSPAQGEFEHAQISLQRLEREKKELQGLVERKAFREEELEREIERLRGGGINGNRESVLSDKTATQERATARDSNGTTLSWRGLRGAPGGANNGLHKRGKSSQMHISLEPMAESETLSTDGSSATLWCEICETGGHDILSCTNVVGTTANTTNGAVQTPKSPARAPEGKMPPLPPPARRDAPESLVPGGLNAASSRSAATTAGMASPLNPPPPSPPAKDPPSMPLPNPFDGKLVAGKGADGPNAAEWCALCERDGHLAMSCPFEDQF